MYFKYLDMNRNTDTIVISGTSFRRPRKTRVLAMNGHNVTLYDSLGQGEDLTLRGQDQQRSNNQTYTPSWLDESLSKYKLNNFGATKTKSHMEGSVKLDPLTETSDKKTSLKDRDFNNELHVELPIANKPHHRSFLDRDLSYLSKVFSDVTMEQDDTALAPTDKLRQAKSEDLLSMETGKNIAMDTHTDVIIHHKPKTKNRINMKCPTSIEQKKTDIKSTPNKNTEFRQLIVRDFTFSGKKFLDKNTAKRKFTLPKNKRRDSFSGIPKLKTNKNPKRSETFGVQKLDNLEKEYKKLHESLVNTQ
ncbi:unnamed protein product [Owenia fusiformis]|uniref:Uncharacterized protein n=1 Tax=Owenia fusiformis TaxID=6347 RepID=A0A8J1TAP5_OWEFU|nr:unnamed protein product [Owenia fusiformis]